MSTQEVPDKGTPNNDKADVVDKVAEYLQAPRKKRRLYIVQAFSPSISRDLSMAIESFVQHNYKSISWLAPKTLDDLARYIMRSIQLLLIDDQLAPMTNILQVVKRFKSQKNSTGMPTLFFTSSPDNLIKNYQNVLGNYHEIDDYIDIKHTPKKQILQLVKRGIDLKNRRKSRRYKVNFPMRFYDLRANCLIEGTFTDLSIHGAAIQSKDGHTFRANDQIMLSIPLRHILPKCSQDYLKISGRIRRVFLSGFQAGLSFEHITEQQSYILSLFLTLLVTRTGTKSS